MKHFQRLRTEVERQVKRMKKAERERPHVLSQTIYIGTLGLLMVLPVVAGAYLGQWLDSLEPGYSIRWTISLLLLGLVVGIFNVYFFVNDRNE